MSISAGVTTIVDTSAIDALILSLQLRVQLVIEQFAVLIESEAKRLCPVLTGALRASIHTTLETYAADIIAGEGLDYASVQEYGSATQPGTAFIRPATERYREAFIAEIQALVGG